MKSLIIKFFTVVFFLLCFSTIISPKAYAAAPDVSGSVFVKGTNAPVVGIWVKWTANDGYIRYAKTNVNGIYTFVSWGKCQTSAECAQEKQMRINQYNTWIDTNLDGVKDARMADTTSYKHFGCVQSPHEFTAVVPKGKNYTFQGVSFSFNNGYVTVHPKTIIEVPPPPACGVSCTTPADCQAAKDGCTTCTGGVCKPPPPACGVRCTTPADCQAAKDGCTTCTGGVCKSPPTPTPPVCGVRCTTPADCQAAKDGCTTCIAGVCKAPPVCGVRCTTPADCQAAKDGCTTCIAGVCKAPPACGVSCTTPADCQAAKDGCTTCIAGVCKAPPACGVRCTTPADCQAAKDGCTTCDLTINKCVTPPPVCGSTCVKTADCAGAKDGCNICTGGVCKAFNPASCACDGIANTDLFSGQNATITSYAKVFGEDVNNAQVVDQKFFLAEGAETIATIIAKSNPIPAIVIDTSSLQVRYQSQWQLQLPQLKPGATYRLWSQINCQPKPSVYSYSSLSRKVVLGQQTQSTSLLDNIVNSVKSFLSSSNTKSLAANNSLQLETVTPVNVYQKTCSFIKFKIGN